VTDPSTAPAPPRPVFTPTDDDGRLVPPGWLEDAPVTRALLALNVCVFLVESVASHSLTGLPTHAALALGASSPLATLGEHRFETLVTACFLHAGLVHLAFNMLALWQAGPLVERSVGSARMAPMYLVAGAFGNLLSVLYGWYSGSLGWTVGASGAILGVIAAALVTGWRVQGWRSPLTQAMARWLGLVILFGVLANQGGGRIDNAAHIGGAVAGAAFAALWKPGRAYSARATAVVLGGCACLLLACIAVVAIRDRTDAFAPMDLSERLEFTDDALREGRCRDALDGVRSVERLGAQAAGLPPIRPSVEEVCGRIPQVSK
jgi:rhomboid protease GluP